MKYFVKEGNTGILTLRSGNGDEELYIPNYDLDSAREILLEFQKIRNTNGTKIMEAYRVEGYNWYPSMVSYLYWHFFFPYVKYQKLVDQWMSGEVEFAWDERKSFAELISNLNERLFWNRFQDKVFYTLLKINNRFAALFAKTDLMFFRFAVNDFRSVEIRKTLSELGADYIQVVPSSTIRDFFKYLVQGEKYYYYGRRPAENRFNYVYDLSAYDVLKQRLFQRATKILETRISSYLLEYRDHINVLKNRAFKTFYGFDDINGYIFPLLYACRTLGIRTIAHQHGAYAKRHVAYIMDGIDPDQFKWFDKLIVWGEYWKEIMLKYSNIYSEDFFIIGANKSQSFLKPQESVLPKPSVILVPYEFLANTYAIGRYIEKLTELGYEVWFKSRSDEALEDQLDAYMLPERTRKKIRVVEDLDEETLQRIDAVAGTMTTMLYEMLSTGKPVWILDTECRHMEDMVENGLAHKVRLDDLDSLGPEYFKTKYDGDGTYFFGTDELAEVLKKHVLS